MRRTRIWRAFAVAAGAAAAIFVTDTAAAQAAGNAVADWNATAATAIIATAGQSPQAAVLSLAMVQGAVYDAVNAIDGGREPYLFSPPAHPSDSKEAAAATAAFRVLVALFPGQRSTLQPLYDASLASVADSAARSGGVAAGEAAAAAMLSARANDGRGSLFTFTFGTSPGAWRLTPPNFGPDPAPWVGNVRPFVVPFVEMLRTAGPSALSSAVYAKDFNEVKALGSLTSTTRTADQTAAAVFWQDSGPAIWNRVFRALAVEKGLDTAQSARLFATASLAGADASIGCWNDKYHWNFWRPLTAIREAANDGNPATEADPAWLPLFNPTVTVSGAPLVTPGFPDHPAGHACISSAYTHALQAFFGSDEIGFTATSNKCSPAPCGARHFARFSDALEEIINARIWAGIHFRTAGVQGAALGEYVVRYMLDHYFGPPLRERGRGGR